MHKSGFISTITVQIPVRDSPLLLTLRRRKKQDADLFFLMEKWASKLLRILSDEGLHRKSSTLACLTSVKALSPQFHYFLLHHVYFIGNAKLRFHKPMLRGIERGSYAIVLRDILGHWNGKTHRVSFPEGARA